MGAHHGRVAAAARAQHLPHLPDFGTEMDALVAQRPDLVRPIDLPHKSLLGKTISGVEIAHDVAEPDGRPTFLLVGTHHARE